MCTIYNLWWPKPTITLSSRDYVFSFVPETPDFKNVRKEMVRYSTKSATKTGHKQRLHASKRTVRAPLSFWLLLWRGNDEWGLFCCTIMWARLLCFRRQIRDDIELMSSACPNLRKVNLVVHYKFSMMDDSHVQVVSLMILNHTGIFSFWLFSQRIGECYKGINNFQKP